MYIVLLRNVFSMILPHGTAKKCETDGICGNFTLSRG